MSTATLIIFKDGAPSEGMEYGNSWGGACRIWDALFEKYVKNPAIPYGYIFSDGNSKKLWALWRNESLSMAERACLAFTFDHFYVSKANFKRLAEHLREFDSMYPVSQKVNHLPKWVEFFESCEADAVGLWATSVSENPWMKWDEDKEESIPVPLSEGHEMYVELEGLVEA